MISNGNVSGNLSFLVSKKINDLKLRQNVTISLPSMTTRADTQVGFASKREMRNLPILTTTPVPIINYGYKDASRFALRELTRNSGNLSAIKTPAPEMRNIFQSRKQSQNSQISDMGF